MVNSSLFSWMQVSGGLVPFSSLSFLSKRQGAGIISMAFPINKEIWENSGPNWKLVKKKGGYIVTFPNLCIKKRKKSTMSHNPNFKNCCVYVGYHKTFSEVFASGWLHAISLKKKNFSFMKLFSFGKLFSFKKKRVLSQVLYIYYRLKLIDRFSKMEWFTA